MIEALDATFELAGRRALVTGASRGIGEAIALGLARFGADVAVTARDVARLADVSAEIETLGRRAVPIAMDMLDVAGIRGGVAEAAAALEGIDLLVVNAGTEEVCPSLEVEEALWDKILETNLKGAFFTAQAVARVMREAAGEKRQGGTIVNVCSLTSAVGVPTAAAYGASKAGLSASPARSRPSGRRSASG
jgi:NAD(P)-dependent dehydrogenase (short-subunit alcohol dehydrogenase family)